MIIEKTTVNYDAIVTKAKDMKINVITWENAKYGASLMVFYRQMFIREGYTYSVKNIKPIPSIK